MEPTSESPLINQAHTDRSTKAARRNNSIALAILVVIAIGITAVVTTSGDDKSARSGVAYTTGDPLAWTAVDARSFGACALVNSGQVKCWGRNNNGQLGNGTTTNSNTPVFVSAVTTATSISAGSYHSCAVLTDGTIKCWGNNSSRQLGDGTATIRTAPVSVIDIPTTSGATATSVSTGDNFSCAVLTGGTIKCWGDNYYGQLGDGTTTIRTSPVSVVGIPTTSGATATSISSSGMHSCAVLTDGTIKCWGLNNWAQLGITVPNSTYRSTPVLVPDISNATSVSTGGSHSCALLSDNSMKCWGNNSEGQVGNDSYDPAAAPLYVSGIATATSISTGEKHSCAMLTGGAIKCWGYNPSGQLGTEFGIASRSPLQVVNQDTSTVTSISGGSEHACALLTGGAINCWGLNNYGQLGISGITSSRTPVSVPNP
jgi:alpha-tubulin suppressor-like RCC1 family protein